LITFVYVNTPKKNAPHPIVAGKDVLYYNSRQTSSGCKWIRTPAQTPMMNKQRGHWRAGGGNYIKNHHNEREGSRGRDLDKGSSGVPVLVFVCGEISFRRNKCQV
ncbi:hypothetical protein J6590_051486, partial [Homalodisca vitripennis]